MVNAAPLEKSKLYKAKPIISIKEARKLLGASANEMTNEELETLIIQQEQMIRFIFRKISVRK